jgi:hypothetical protein
MATTFSNKVHILGQLERFYKSDDHFVDFIAYHNLGVPLASMISLDVCQANEAGEKIINETWDSLLDQIGISDTGFEDIDDVFIAGNVIIVE